MNETRWYQKSFRDIADHNGLQKALEISRHRGYTGLYIGDVMTAKDLADLKSLFTPNSTRFRIMVEVPYGTLKDCEDLENGVEVNARIDWSPRFAVAEGWKGLSAHSRVSLHFSEIPKHDEIARVCSLLAFAPPGSTVHLVFPFSASALMHKEFRIHRFVKLLRERFPLVKFSGPVGWGLALAPLSEEQRHPKLQVVATRNDGSHPPLISVVIPTFDKWRELHITLQSLQAQNFKSFEVIIVDTGSQGRDWKSLTDTLLSGMTFPWTVIALENQAHHQMGDTNFRAALARNLGAARARGTWLSFLDDDIVVPPHYLEWVNHHCSEKIMVMGQRWESAKPTPLYWSKFYAMADQWNQIERPWRYVCTHSLTVKSSLFQAVGGFRECFTSYGFEDGEFAFRLRQAGVQFRLTPFRVLHQAVPTGRLEWSGSALRRWKLLQTTASLFYRITLSEDVFAHCKYLFYRPRWLTRFVLTGLDRFRRIITGIKTAGPYFRSKEPNSENPESSWSPLGGSDFAQILPAEKLIPSAKSEQEISPSA